MWRLFQPHRAIPKPLINRRQLRPQIHHDQLHSRTPTRPAPLLRLGRHPPPQPSPLPRRIHRQHPEISHILFARHVHASYQRPGSILGQQKFAGSKMRQSLRAIQPLHLLEAPLLHRKRRVHQRLDCCCILQPRLPHPLVAIFRHRSFRHRSFRHRIFRHRIFRH